MRSRSYDYRSRHDKGAVALIAAFAVPVALMFIALAVDTAHIFDRRV